MCPAGSFNRNFCGDRGLLAQHVVKVGGKSTAFISDYAKSADAGIRAIYTKNKRNIVQYDENLRGLRRESREKVTGYKFASI